MIIKIAPKAPKTFQNIIRQWILSIKLDFSDSYPLNHFKPNNLIHLWIGVLLEISYL